MEEVRYERLRPSQIVKRRKECPVAYLPIGTIEWHGEHNPVGLDTLKIHGIAIRCAQVHGGLVFPPLYYGEDREHGLMEAIAADKDRILEKMELPVENFSSGYMFCSPSEQDELYIRLLLHIMYEIASLGFRVIVIAAGHYPLIDYGRAAANIFHQRLGRVKGIASWVFTGYELVQDVFEKAGDHAGIWETSLLMLLDPGMQDLSVLPRDRSAKLIGASNNGVQDSSVEYGQRALEAIVERVGKKVKELLDIVLAQGNLGHGTSI